MRLKKSDMMEDGVSKAEKLTSILNAYVVQVLPLQNLLPIVACTAMTN